MSTVTVVLYYPHPPVREDPANYDLLFSLTNLYHVTQAAVGLNQSKCLTHANDKLKSPKHHTARDARISHTITQCYHATTTPGDLLM